MLLLILLLLSVLLSGVGLLAARKYGMRVYAAGCAVLFVPGIGLLIKGIRTQSRIDANGYLHEPGFPLAASGVILVLLALMVAIIGLAAIAWRRYRRRRAQQS
jgi:uncharacterized membrane protein